MRRDDGRLRIAGRHGHRIEEYHIAQGSTNDCGPHAATVAINFWRGSASVEAAALAQDMNHPRLGLGFPPLVIRRIPNWATLPWGIADALRQHGLHARWRVRASETDLHRALRDDHLLMPIFGEPFRLRGLRWAGWSHVAILVEWDPAESIYYFVDSAHRVALSGKAQRTFLREWSNMGRLLVEAW